MGEARGDFWEEEEWVGNENQALMFFFLCLSILLYTKVVTGFNFCITS